MKKVGYDSPDLIPPRYVAQSKPTHLTTRVVSVRITRQQLGLLAKFYPGVPISTILGKLIESATGRDRQGREL